MKNLIVTIFFLCTFSSYAQWQATGPYNGQSMAIEKIGNNIVTGSWTGTMYSSDNGNSWKQSLYYGLEKNIYSLAVNGNKIFAGTNRTGVYVSTDYGISWQMSYPVDIIRALTSKGDTICGGCATSPGTGGVVATTNSGTNWSQIGLVGKYVTSVAVSGGNIIAGTSNSGIYTTTNFGVNWTNTLTGYGIIHSLAAKDNYVFAGASSNGIFISTDYGLTWNQSTLTNASVLSLKFNGTLLYAGSESNGFYVSSNNGLTFSRYNFPYDVKSIGFSGNNIFAGTIKRGIYKSTDSGASWIMTPYGNQKVMGFKADSLKLYAGSYDNGLQFSTDGGSSWIQSDLESQHLNSIATDGGNVYAGAELLCSSIGMFRSTNGGYNFHEAGFYYDVLVTSMTVSGGNLLIGAWMCIDSGGVYVSTDKGNTFTRTLSYDIRSLYANGNNVYAGLVAGFNEGSGIYLSTNSGFNWQSIGPLGKSVSSVTVSGSKIFAGINNGVQMTTNNGVNWTQSLTSSRGTALLSAGNYLFAGTEKNGVYFSSDNGLNWVQKNQGLVSNQQITHIGLQNNKLYASTYGNSVFVRDLAEIVSVNNISEEIPTEYLLSQNYPNPFNPITTIKFSIPKATFVEIAVYDITGREIETLVNESLQAGTYQTTWNAASYPSGVYFYKIVSDNYTETKKMLLIK